MSFIFSKRRISHRSSQKLFSAKSLNFWNLFWRSICFGKSHFLIVYLAIFWRSFRRTCTAKHTISRVNVRKNYDFRQVLQPIFFFEAEKFWHFLGIRILRDCWIIYHQCHRCLKSFHCSPRKCVSTISNLKFLKVAIITGAEEQHFFSAQMRRISWNSFKGT